MTALRQELFDIVNLLPEDKISVALQYIRENLLPQPKKKTSQTRDITTKKFALKENADEIQASIDFIKSLHKFMDGSTANKTLKELREERLREKYAEYFN